MLIAQISDIHASPENDHLQRLDQTLAWLAQLQPDVLVLSGDLTDDFWLEGYKQIARRLRQQHYPSLILPGNSDDRRMMREVWGNSMWADDAPCNALHALYDAGGLRLIGLDSTVDAQDYGSVTPHLGWLEKRLTEANGSPTMLFMHHPVFASGIPTLDNLMCRERAPLEALIRKSPGVLAIAAGHVHRPVAGLFAGVPAYICGSVCPANPVWFGTINVPPVGDPPALMIHRYSDGALSSHHVGV